MIRKIAAQEAAKIAERFLSIDRLSPPITADCPAAEFLSRFELILGDFQGDSLKSAFAFIVDSENRYYEAVWVLSEDAAAVAETVRHLKVNYPDFAGDWVINPQNTAVTATLESLGAENYGTSRGYLFDGPIAPVTVDNILPLEEKHHTEYAKMHSKDVYWTAERVIGSGRFATWVALAGGHVVGYIDLFRDHDMSEVYDWQATSSELKASLMRTAVSHAKSPVLIMSDDSEAENAEILRNIGFKRTPHRDNTTLHLDLNALANSCT